MTAERWTEETFQTVAEIIADGEATSMYHDEATKVAIEERT